MIFAYIYLIVLVILMIGIPILIGYDDAKTVRYQTYSEDDTIKYFMGALFWPVIVVIAIFVLILAGIQKCISLAGKGLLGLGARLAKSRRLK